jgi:hypothetical protein
LKVEFPGVGASPLLAAMPLRGIQTRNVEPSPGRLDTEIVPPISSVSRRAT